MSVDSYSYGTVAGVQQKVGWVVPSRTFTGSTKPTTTEVENLVDQAASEIHAKLAEAGYPVDTKTVVTASAPRAVKWLEALNEAGACAMVVMSYGIAGDPESGTNPSGFWKKQWEDGKKMISGRFLNDLGLTRTRALSSHLVSGSTYDEDGNAKEALFQRGMFNNPDADVNDEDDD